MESQADFWKTWFCREVLPREPSLMRFIHRNWRAPSEHDDLRQEIYVRVLEAARVNIPLNVGPFLFTVARNYLIDRARRARIVQFEVIADLEDFDVCAAPITPEKIASAREELRIVQRGLELLPKRCREVIVLRRIHGLSQKEVAVRLGVSVKAVEQQTTKGMRSLINYVLHEHADEVATQDKPVVRREPTEKAP